jgi:DNA-binding beta-propeller fold protein YncE
MVPAWSIDKPGRSQSTGRHPASSVKFNRVGIKRLYVTNRDAGSVTAYDSESYKKVVTYDVPTHPNSLALDAKKNVLYVTIKNGDEDEKGSEESVARIAL